MSCTSDCVHTGIKTLVQIIEVIIQGATCQNPNLSCPISKNIIQLLTNAITTFQCKLPQNIINLISTQISLLDEQATNNVQQTNTAYIVVIFVTLFILVIFNYVNTLMASSTATIVFFVLSLFIVILGAIILYLWLKSIFNNSTLQVTKILTHIKNVLNDVITAGQEGFCCLGQCTTCTTCTTSIL